MEAYGGLAVSSQVLDPSTLSGFWSDSLPRLFHEGKGTLFSVEYEPR